MNHIPCPDCNADIPEGFSHDCPGPGPATRELIAKLEATVDDLANTAEKADQLVLKKVLEVERKVSDLKCADNVAILARKRIHERLAALEAWKESGVPLDEDFWRRVEALEEWQRKAKQFKFPTP